MRKPLALLALRVPRELDAENPFVGEVEPISPDR
jgi:hypothetical protein